MQLLTRITLFALACLPAQAPQPEPPPSSAKDLLEASSLALRDVRTATYAAAHTVDIPEQPNSAPPAASGRVALARLEANDPPDPPDPVGAKLSIEGRLEKTPPTGADVPFHIGYEGRAVRARIGGGDVVFEADPRVDGGDLLDFGDRLVMRKLFVADPFAKEMTADSLERQEDEDVGGVRCHVVAVSYGEERKDERVLWFLGAEDHLPRRVRTHFVLHGKSGVEELTLRDLATNVELDEAAFLVPVPEGAALKAYQRPPEPQRGGSGLLALGSVAPEFELEDAQGKVHKLSEYKGRVVVLDFWATWCPPCRQAMPHVQKLHERFEKRDVLVFGISCGERSDPVATPARYMKEQGFTYRLLVKGENVAHAYMVQGIPTFYVISKDGKVLSASSGFDPKGADKLAEQIEKELARR